MEIYVDGGISDIWTVVVFGALGLGVFFALLEIAEKIWHGILWIRRKIKLEPRRQDTSTIIRRERPIEWGEIFRLKRGTR